MNFNGTSAAVVSSKYRKKFYHFSNTRLKVNSVLIVYFSCIPISYLFEFFVSNTNLTFLAILYHHWIRILMPLPTQPICHSLPVWDSHTLIKPYSIESTNDPTPKSEVLFNTCLDDRVSGGSKGGGARGTRATPSGPKFLHFHAVFGKNWPNNRLAPLPLGLVPPPLGNPGSATESGICLLIHRWLVLWVWYPLEATLFLADFKTHWC